MAGLIAPSVLSADFANLAVEVADVESAGADWLHIDVMDGHFVPNLTIGPVVVESLRPRTRLPLDCHLMVARPEDWIERFAKAGADIITLHVETMQDPALLKQIRGLGKKAGISLRPGTELSAIQPYLDEVDLVLVMSVEPGFGGQAFMESTYTRLIELKTLRGDRPFLIEVDGGVGSKNISKLYQHGAQVFVAGNAVFAKPDRAAAMRELKAGCQ